MLIVYCWGGGSLLCISMHYFMYSIYLFYDVLICNKMYNFTKINVTKKLKIFALLKNITKLFDLN